MSMTAVSDLLRLIKAIAEEETRGLEQAMADGIVDTVEGQYASVRLGANAAATPGFWAAPSLALLAGDHVLTYRRKGYQLVLTVLQRNAVAPSVVAGDNVVLTAQTDGSVVVDAVPFISQGAGSPEGVVVADLGSLYLRTDGGTSTTLYIKTSGPGLATGWTAK